MRRSSGYAVSYLRIVSLGFPFYGYGMVLSQSFNGAGDTRTPTLINLGVFWALQIPLAWLLSHHTSLQAYGVFVTLAVSFSVFAVVSVLAFPAWCLETNARLVGRASCRTR